MVNSNALFRAFLLQDVTENPIRALTTKVYVGTLPQTFDPAAGPAIQITVRGGSSDMEAPIDLPSFQLKVWAGKEQYALAQKVYRAVHDWVHGRTMVDLGADGTILSCLETSQGQDITDPDTGWATVLTFFQLMVRE